MADKTIVPSYSPLGDSAIVVGFGHQIHPDIHKKISTCSHILDQNPFPGMVEYVPAYTTLTIYYNPWIVSENGKLDPYQAVLRYLQESFKLESSRVEIPEREISIPVCYGGEWGPDLDYVAARTQLSTEEVIKIHTAVDYLVYMIGFAPGFPYLGGMDPRIAVDRKKTPALNVPAGSVGIAGSQTGVYPLSTPGGWQIIGRTPLRLFTPEEVSPTLLRAGDKIRFVQISADDFLKIKSRRDGA